MAEDFGLDFGLLIAYVVPGMLVVLGVAAWSPSFRGFGKKVWDATSAVGPLTLLIGACLTAGMFMSILRAAYLDPSFSLELRPASLQDCLPKHFGPIERDDPDYTRLATKERLAAFLAAQANDKRPYQFYGNALLAWPILVVGSRRYLRSHSQKVVWRRALWLIAIFVAVTLYGAARQSHYRYMNTVHAFNDLPQIVQ